MKLSLYYPVTPANLNQAFGSNGAYYRANGINIIGHNGDDFATFHGQPIYAAHDGTAYYERDDSGGEGVVVISDKAYDFNGKQAFFKTIYWHMCDPEKEPKYASQIYLANRKYNSGLGVAVKAGDQIGWADSTGLSTGDHLHFGLKPIVPGNPPFSGDAPDINIGDWVNVVPDNGYLGAIDPMPYFNHFYASDAAKVTALLEQEVNVLQQFVNILKANALKKKI